jgi:hypothetical protein
MSTLKYRWHNDREVPESLPPDSREFPLAPPTPSTITAVEISGPKKIEMQGAGGVIAKITARAALWSTGRARYREGLT